MKLFKKILKIISIIFILLFIGVYILFVNFSSPKSDIEIVESFKEDHVTAYVSIEKFKNFKYRVVSVQKELDSNKTNLVFIHGAIGSSSDFKEYMTDSLLRSKFNMISYDRIGYNFEDKTLAQQSLKFEVSVLESLISKLKYDNTILVGYSYGGPIALMSKKKYKNIVLLAPAVYSKVEPMPFMLNVYKWKLTRWLVPHVWKSASLEKMNHKEELNLYENNWNENPSKIISVHGDSDGIVPYENSLFLEKQFPKNQFELKTIKNAGHSLVWSNFELIKNELLKLKN